MSDNKLDLVKCAEALLDAAKNAPPKRGRGRPRKAPAAVEPAAPKRPRGRPPSAATLARRAAEAAGEPQPPKRGRGRPRKSPVAEKRDEAMATVENIRPVSVAEPEPEWMQAARGRPLSLGAMMAARYLADPAAIARTREAMRRPLALGPGKDAKREEEERIYNLYKSVYLYFTNRGRWQLRFQRNDEPLQIRIGGDVVAHNFRSREEALQEVENRMLVIVPAPEAAQRQSDKNLASKSKQEFPKYGPKPAELQHLPPAVPPAGETYLRPAEEYWRNRPLGYLGNISLGDLPKKDFNQAVEVIRRTDDDLKDWFDGKDASDVVNRVYYTSQILPDGSELPNGFLVRSTIAISSIATIGDERLTGADIRITYDIDRRAVLLRDLEPVSNTVAKLLQAIPDILIVEMDRKHKVLGKKGSLKIDEIYSLLKNPQTQTVSVSWDRYRVNSAENYDVAKRVIKTLRNFRPYQLRLYLELAAKLMHENAEIRLNVKNTGLGN